MASATVKCAVFFGMIVGVALAFPASTPATLVSKTEVHDETGQFALSYQLSDGTIVNEQGALKKNSDGTDYVLVKQGSHYFITPEGTPVRLTYVADENGYRAEGAHLPVPPQPITPTF